MSLQMMLLLTNWKLVNIMQLLAITRAIKDTSREKLYQGLGLKYLQ